MAIWPAILITSLLFGGIHSLNVFITGHLLTSVIQSGAALLSGLLFIFGSFADPFFPAPRGARQQQPRP